MEDLTPRERRQQRTYDAILKTAIEIVREKGADKLSLREIARRIDYSPAGLYEYFDSKDDIIDAICREGNARLYQRMKRANTALDFDDYMLALSREYIRFAVEDSDYFLLMFSRVVPREVEISADELLTYVPSEDDSMTPAYNAIQKAIEAGMIESNNQPTMQVALGFWSVVHGLAMLRITHWADYPIDFEIIETNTVRTFLRGIRK